MAIVHMKALDLVIAKGAEHSDSPDSEDRLLTESVTLIPSIERVGQRSVPFGIFGKIRVQKIDRHFEAARITDFVFPGTDVNASPF